MQQQSDRAAPMQKSRFSLVTTARWETDAIVEWALYNYAIGFEHIYVYCNDDDPRELYTVLMPFMSGPEPRMTFVHFGLQGQQRQMLLHYLKRFRHESDWIAFFDVDEFLSLRRHKTLSEYMAEMPADADCVYFNWIFFGTSGYKTRPTGPVLRNFTHRQSILHPFTKVMVKTAYVTDDWLNSNPIHPFWHDIGDLLGKLNIYNAIGEHAETYYHDFPDAAARSLAGDRSKAILNTALLHHYTLKSEQDFKRRVDRGTKGDYHAQTNWMDMVRKGSAEEFVRSTNEVEDLTLSHYWDRLVSKADVTTVIKASDLPNVALDRPATQSSICSWSVGNTPEADARNAVNGRITSRYQCHTGEDDPAWWQVDLQGYYAISEIRVFNRLDMARERLSRMMLSVKSDDDDWTPVFRKDDDTVVGGADGTPLIWRPATTVKGRAVRLTLLTKTYLNLDQVEVYGVPL